MLIPNRRPRIEIVKIHKSCAGKDCSCRVIHKPVKDPTLVIRVEVFPSTYSGNSTRETNFMSFQLRKTTKISLLGSCTPVGNPYPYRIKWTVGKMEYELRVCKLALISELNSLNELFQV